MVIDYTLHSKQWESGLGTLLQQAQNGRIHVSYKY